MDHLYNIGWFEVDNRRYRPSLENYCTSRRRVQYFAWRGAISSVINRKNPSNIIIIIHQKADLTKICLLVEQIK